MTEEHDPSNKLNSFKDDDQVSVMDNQSQFGDMPLLRSEGSGPQFMKDNIQVPFRDESKMKGFGIETALYHQDGRCHFVFTDKTSLIIHPNGDCFTYFKKDGKKLRQLVKFAISGDALEKLLLAIQLYNTYSEIPILTRPEIFSELARKQSKMTKVTWPGLENVDEYTWVDEEGNTHLRSVD